ncbi:hypothetical protein DM860_006602 [Cuscuta australis]|uniref:Uncharacterized protein n=1 Tax=Cuscuta australis TaxID=267555 RepID=A0A328D3Y8_9ASTE|nr:hypothetical protein DM860_006602 [Cuscuta australis]
MDCDADLQTFKIYKKNLLDPYDSAVISLDDHGSKVQIFANEFRLLTTKVSIFANRFRLLTTKNYYDVDYFDAKYTESQPSLNLSLIRFSPEALKYGIRVRVGHCHGQGLREGGGGGLPGHVPPRRRSGEEVWPAITVNGGCSAPERRKYYFLKKSTPRPLVVCPPLASFWLRHWSWEKLDLEYELVPSLAEESMASLWAITEPLPSKAEYKNLKSGSASGTPNPTLNMNGSLEFSQPATVKQKGGFPLS